MSTATAGASVAALAANRPILYAKLQGVSLLYTGLALATDIGSEKRQVALGFDFGSNFIADSLGVKKTRIGRITLSIYEAINTVVGWLFGEAAEND